MRVEVECYAGRKAEERPVRFRLEGHVREVAEVVEQWYEPSGVFFKVRADDGILYTLHQHTAAAAGEWSLVSFRELKKN